MLKKTLFEGYLDSKDKFWKYPLYQGKFWVNLIDFSPLNLHPEMILKKIYPKMIKYSRAMKILPWINLITAGYTVNLVAISNQQKNLNKTMNPI